MTHLAGKAEPKLWPDWVANSIQMGLVVLNSQGCVHYFNDWMLERSGLSHEQVMGHSLLEVFPELALGRFGLALNACLDNGLPSILSNSLNPTPFPLFDDPMQRAQAVRVQQSVRIFRSPTQVGVDFQVLIEISDVSGAVRRERLLREQAFKLKMLSSIDPLTGLANRRSLDAVLDKEFRRASRGKLWLGLIMIDIDVFKPFNDNYGHPAGDRCLVQVAGAMQQFLNRPHDLVARYGGEEFVAVLPETDLHGAVAVARRLRLAVESLRIPHSQSSHGGVVTVSQGVSAMLPTVGGNFESLITQADMALYEAKRSGRNRVAALPQGDSSVE